MRHGDKGHTRKDHNENEVTTPTTYAYPKLTTSHRAKSRSTSRGAIHCMQSVWVNAAAGNRVPSWNTSKTMLAILNFHPELPRRVGTINMLSATVIGARVRG